MSRSIQLKPEFKKSIKALLPRNHFPSQQALTDHLGLSRDVISRFLNGKPVDRLNAEEICQALGFDIREVTYIEETQRKQTKIDWGEAISSFDLFDRSARTKELETLTQWITEDKCRVILIEAIKGMGKSHLSYQLVQENKNDFDFVSVRSLDQYESIDELLTDWLYFINNEEDINQWLASSSYDTSIRLWKLSSTQYSCDKILLGHGNAVMCVTFHPHEPILASSSKDGTIKRWNYLTGECLSSWRSPRPYENMNITGVTGLNSAQKYALKTLGAIEN
ncbi:MAG: hypothetical protein QNJ37_22995 [Crocosphaera sp.]|nr:hypothetical protein [Crocosphaera sp.]